MQDPHGAGGDQVARLAWTMSGPVAAETAALPTAPVMQLVDGAGAMLPKKAPLLYTAMMRSIGSGHTLGNTIRMLKLPLIFLEEELYFAAIAQFFWLTEALEAELDGRRGESIVDRVLELGIRATPGYAVDLEGFWGAGWRQEAARHRTSATEAYVRLIRAADPVELVAAAFILWGALVVGGGKSTQAKVRSVFPRYAHRLYDVVGDGRDDIKAMRGRYKNVFNAIGREWPEHGARLERDAARFMAQNNAVILSIRTVGGRAQRWALAAAAVVGVVLAMRWVR